MKNNITSMLVCLEEGGGMGAVLPLPTPSTDISQSKILFVKNFLRFIYIQCSSGIWSYVYLWLLFPSMTRLLVEVGAGLSLDPWITPWLSLMPGVMLRHCCLALCPLDMGQQAADQAGHPLSPLHCSPLLLFSEFTFAQVHILTLITIHGKFGSSTLLLFHNRIAWSQN